MHQYSISVNITNKRRLTTRWVIFEGPKHGFETGQGQASRTPENIDESRQYSLEGIISGPVLCVANTHRILLHACCISDVLRLRVLLLTSQLTKVETATSLWTMACPFLNACSLTWSIDMSTLFTRHHCKMILLCSK